MENSCYVRYVRYPFVRRFNILLGWYTFAIKPKIPEAMINISLKRVGYIIACERYHNF